MNLEQALKFLGGDFAKCQIGNNKNQAFSKHEGGGLSVCFRYTKAYENNIWWTGETPLNMDICQFIIIALQNLGLAVLPRKTVLDYWENLNVSTLKNGRRNIRLKLDNGRVFIYNKKDQTPIDISEFFHPVNVC